MFLKCARRQQSNFWKIWKIHCQESNNLGTWSCTCWTELNPRFHEFCIKTPTNRLLKLRVVRSCVVFLMAWSEWPEIMRNGNKRYGQRERNHSQAEAHFSGDSGANKEWIWCHTALISPWQTTLAREWETAFVWLYHHWDVYLSTFSAPIKHSVSWILGLLTLSWFLFSPPRHQMLLAPPPQVFC